MNLIANFPEMKMSVRRITCAALTSTYRSHKTVVGHYYYLLLF